MVKRSILTTVILVGVLFVAGCFVAPPQEAIKHSPGAYPSDYESLIKNYLKYQLVDPKSLKDFTIVKPPEKVILQTAHPAIPLYIGQLVWECFVAYNAKNENGVYVGQDMHVVWIRYNRVVAFDYQEPGLRYRVDERIKNPGY